MKRVGFIITVVASVIACTNKKQTSDSNATIDSSAQTTSAPPTVGGDKDEHGCIGSAGYQWSVLKNKCIRTFEEADAKLLPTKDTASYTSNAVLIFNADQSKVELYMPNQKGSLILDRTGKEGNYIWKNDSLEVFAWKGYALRKNGNVIFQGE